MPGCSIPKSVNKAIQGSRVAQRSKALHLSARGVTTDPGLIPGGITTGRDWDPINKNLFLSDLPS